MDSRTIRRWLAIQLICLLFVILGPAAAGAQTREELEAMSSPSGVLSQPKQELEADSSPSGALSGDQEERIQELETQLATIARELDKLRKASTVPEEKPLRSAHGLGPAASKVYQKDRGLSLGGYGEALVRVPVGKGSDAKHAIADLERFVLYAGYKFSDRILFNTELEFEHAGTGGGGSVSVEFMTLDFLLAEEANIRAGLVLNPMGIINEIHEPVYRYGNSRPEVERRIIPTTWREIGGGLYGELGDTFSYRLYGVNGLDATGFANDGLRDGRQKGSRALADDWAMVARLDVTPLDGLLVGGSVYVGNSGQDQTLTAAVGGASLHVPDTLTTIYEFHLVYEARGATFRGLFTQALLKDAGQLSTVLMLNDPSLGLNESVASNMLGGYAEFAYDVLPLVFPNTTMSLEPFYRFEYIDTQHDVASGFIRDRKEDQNIHVVGLQYKPHPQVVVKTDYRLIDPHSGVVANEWSLGFGFVY